MPVSLGSHQLPSCYRINLTRHQGFSECRKTDLFQSLVVNFSVERQKYIFKTVHGLPAGVQNHAAKLGRAKVSKFNHASVTTS